MLMSGCGNVLIRYVPIIAKGPASLSLLSLVLAMLPQRHLWRLYYRLLYHRRCAFRYRYPELPTHLTSSAIVRFLKDVHVDAAWLDLNNFTVSKLFAFQWPLTERAKFAAKSPSARGGSSISPSRPTMMCLG